MKVPHPLSNEGEIVKKSDPHPNLITRRKLTKLAGAMAASAAIPPVAAAQNANPVADRQNALDHVVVVMFENRSFDHLMGRLYEPGEVRSFEGVNGKGLKNPIPGGLSMAPTASSSPTA